MWQWDQCQCHGEFLHIYFVKFIILDLNHIKIISIFYDVKVCWLLIVFFCFIIIFNVIFSDSTVDINNFIVCNSCCVFSSQSFMLCYVLIHSFICRIMPKLGPNLQNFVGWTFVILLQFFLMSFVCQLSYRTKSLRTNYAVYN